MAIHITAIDQSIGISNEFPGGPLKAVAAVFLADKDEYSENPLHLRRCLGTAFLIHGYDIHFLTARHVIEQSLKDNEMFVLVFDQDVFDRDGNSRLTLPVESLSLSTTTDLAYGTLKSDESIQLPGFQLVRNIRRYSNYANLEHSGTGVNPQDSSVLFSVRLNKGYIVSQDRYSNPGTLKGSEILEMSFPCLRGASGSPVFDHGSLDLAGMMVQNVDHELDPSQLIKNVDDEGRLIEEIKYTIPQGIALSVAAINQELDRRVLH